MIALKNVGKRFGRLTALHPMDLEIPAGVIWGLLGHNGAGKSTLIGMLLGQVAPSGGRVTIDGHDVGHRRDLALARVGAMYETPAFYPYLTGWVNLRMFCDYTHPAPADVLMSAVRRVGLEYAIHRRVGAYSCGMRQRLALAQALVPEPKLLILDEPGQGLDPNGFLELRRLLLDLHGRDGMTILLSSHLLSEVEQLCSHVTILKRGRLVFSGRWNETDERRIVVRADRRAEAVEGLARDGLIEPSLHADEATLMPGRTLAEAAEWLVSRGFRIEALAPVPQSLEAFYLRHDRGAEDGAA